MRTDFETLQRIEFAARRERARAIAELIGSAFAWVLSQFRSRRHAARPHFAR